MADGLSEESMHKIALVARAELDGKHTPFEARDLVREILEEETATVLSEFTREEANNG